MKKSYLYARQSRNNLWIQKGLFQHCLHTFTIICEIFGKHIHKLDRQYYYYTGEKPFVCDTYQGTFK